MKKLSMLRPELPTAESQFWSVARPKVPKGRVQRDRFISKVLLFFRGLGTDGTVGLEGIKAEGGITFAQDDAAKYDSMPRSAVAAGCVDFVLSPEYIAKELGRIAQHPSVAGPPLDSNR